MDRQRREKRHLATPDDSRSSPKRHKGCCEQQGRSHARKRTRKAVPEPVDLYSFKVPDRSSPNPPRSKSKDGHFRFVNGDNIGSRYKILNMIGEGTFGRVLECWDRQTRTIVAVKVIRSVPKYRDAAMIELEVLSTITANDPDKRHCCIHLQHWFDYRGHVCIVFEKLGMSLYDFMHKNNFRPFPLDIVQHFARQMLHALVFLHSLSVVHTDLKPENMLLTSSEHTKLDKEKHSKLGCRVPVSTDMRVIDFGSATFEEERHSTVVSTRHYRAPEVILGLGWSYQCDIWSAGCIIVELITGRALFQTHDNLEHLAMMERVLEKVPPDMSRRASTDASKYFKDDMLLWSASASRKSVKAVQQLTSLRRLLRFEADSSATPHLDSLYGLLKEMLCFRPGERSSARSCLEHDFFRENIRSLLPRRDDSSEQRRSGSKEQEVAVVQQRVSHASRATSESCPVACIPKGGHKRNVSAAGEGNSGVKRRPVVVAEQDGRDDLDAPAEPDTVRNHQPHLLVRPDVSDCGENGAAVLDSHATAKMELRPDTEHSGAEMLAAAAQLGAKMRGSDTAAPSVKSSGSFWHDATVSQDSGAPRDETAKQDARPDNRKASCIGSYAAVDDDTRTSDLAENVSWPHRLVLPHHQ